MTTEKLPPKILIVEGESKAMRAAQFIGVHAGLPIYQMDSLVTQHNSWTHEAMLERRDRLTADTERAMGMIGKALEPEPGNLDKNA